MHRPNTETAAVTPLAHPLLIRQKSQEKNIQVVLHEALWSTIAMRSRRCIKGQTNSLRRIRKNGIVTWRKQKPPC